MLAPPHHEGRKPGCLSSPGWSRVETNRPVDRPARDGWRKTGFWLIKC